MRTDYRIFETDAYLKALEKLDPPDQRFLERKNKAYVYPQLRKEPHYGNNIKKLRGYNPDIWRYRIGSFRIFYSIDTSDRVVYLLALDRKKNAYR